MNVVYSGFVSMKRSLHNEASSALALQTVYALFTRAAMGIVAGACLFFSSIHAQAAGITVTSLADDGGGALCTLREAIDSANTDSAVGGCATGNLADLIVFNSGLTGGIITLTGGALTIQSTVIINGDINSDDSPDIEVSGGNVSQVFHITGGGNTAVVEGLTISDGSATSGAGVLIDNGALAYLINDAISSNAATVRGGGVVVESATTEISGGTVSNNTSDINGGGIYASGSAIVTISDAVISDNAAIFAGGGLYVHGTGTTVTLNDSDLSNNTLSNAAGDGAGVFVYTASFAADNSTITDNTAPRSGGGLFIDQSSTVTLNDSGVSDNTASPGGGGGVFIDGNSGLTITDSILSGNYGSNNGGGIFANSATVDISGTTVSGNTTDYAGGGIRGQDSSDISLTGSTVSANTAGSGGGLSLTGTSDVSLVNSTVSSNTAASTGGGLYSASGQATLTNTTFSDNTAGTAGGGLYITDSASGVVQLTNTIVANSIGGDCQAGTLVSFTSTGSLIEDGGFDCGTPALAVDPQLLVLTDNGGLTETHMPQSDSPVVDSGDNTDCGTGKVVVNDQRGEMRDDGLCDIGAVELQSATLQWSADAASINEDDGSVALTVSRTEFTGNAVSVDYTSADGTAISPDDYSADMNTLYFSIGDISESVSISINDDILAEGRESFDIVLSNPQTVPNGDRARLGSKTTVTVTIDDDDPGILVQPVRGLQTTEAGGTDDFTMVLTSQPTADVIISISSGNTAEGTVSPSSLTFTSSNWDQPKNVVVTGVDDDIDDGDTEFTIKTGPVSGATEYAGVNPADVTATNIDDDDAVSDDESSAGGGGSSGGFAFSPLLSFLMLMSLGALRSRSY